VHELQRRGEVDAELQAFLGGNASAPFDLATKIFGE